MFLLSRRAGAVVLSVGVLAGGFSSSVAYLSSATADSPPVALNANEFRAFPLVHKETLTHNTSLYRFALPSPDHVLGLTVASCLSAQLPGIGADGAAVSRPYTPVTPPETRGHFDLIIKTYPTGAFTPHLAKLKVGDVVEFKGPWKKIDYTPNMKKKIGMIAGGTGITPMLQVLREALKRAPTEDQTQFTLLFANVSETDIMLKKELLDLQRTYPSNLRVHFIVDRTDNKNWNGFTGYVTKELVQMLMPPPSPDNMIFVCGPPGMMNIVCGPKDKMQQGELKGFLAELGYKPEQVFKF